MVHEKTRTFYLLVYSNISYSIKYMEEYIYPVNSLHQGECEHFRCAQYLYYQDNYYRQDSHMILMNLIILSCRRDGHSSRTVIQLLCLIHQQMSAFHARKKIQNERSGLPILCSRQKISSSCHITMHHSVEPLILLNRPRRSVVHTRKHVGQTFSPLDSSDCSEKQAISPKEYLSCIATALISSFFAGQL